MMFFSPSPFFHPTGCILVHVYTIFQLDDVDHFQWELLFALCICVLCSWMFMWFYYMFMWIAIEFILIFIFCTMLFLLIAKLPCGYGSIPINTIFRGMNIHLPAILMFTRGTRFWHTAMSPEQSLLSVHMRSEVWFLQPSAISPRDPWLHRAGSTDGDVNSALRKTLVKLAKGSLMVYWCLLILIDVYWCVLMFIDVYWCLLMFVDVLMLLMFIDVCWCLPEIGRFTIIYSIVVHRKLSARYLSWNLAFGQGFCSDWWMSLGRIVLNDVTTTSM